MLPSDGDATSNDRAWTRSCRPTRPSPDPPVPAGGDGGRLRRIDGERKPLGRFPDALTRGVRDRSRRRHRPQPRSQRNGWAHRRADRQHRADRRAHRRDHARADRRGDPLGRSRLGLQRDRREPGLLCGRLRGCRLDRLLPGPAEGLVRRHRTLPSRRRGASRDQLPGSQRCQPDASRRRVLRRPRRLRSQRTGGRPRRLRRP